MIRLQNYVVVLFLAISTFLIWSCEDDKKEITPYQRPVVMEVVPSEALRGEEVTIKGTDLTEVAGVKFGSIGLSYFKISDNTVTMTVPDGLDEGETQITVFYAGQTENNLGPAASIPFKVLYPPGLVEVLPEQAKPGFEVTLNGNHLKEAFSLKFDTISAPFQVSQTSITTKVPDMEPGKVEISVETPGGIANMTFLVLPKTPEIYTFEPAEGGRAGDEVSVFGKFFIDVQSVSIGSVEVSEFTVVDDSEILFTIPEGATKNKVTITTSIGEVVSEADLNIIEIPYLFYDEGLHADIQNWGWGGNDDFNSTKVTKEGSYSYERTYTEAWSGIQLHHGSLNLSPYSSMEISIYGGSGTKGKILNLNINWGANYEVKVIEGKWQKYIVALADLGNPEILSELILQENGDTGISVPFTVFLDDIRLIE